MFPAVKDYPPGTELIYRDAQNRQASCVVMHYGHPDTAIDSRTGGAVDRYTVPSYVVVDGKWRPSSQAEVDSARQRFAARIAARKAKGNV